MTFVHYLGLVDIFLNYCLKNYYLQNDSFNNFSVIFFIFIIYICYDDFVYFFGINRVVDRR